MYNHARTLLLNTNQQRPEVPGEELIPRNFRPFQLPRYLEVARSVLFGLDPDRFMLHYRARQFLTLIAATDLQQYLDDLDPRVTYDLRRSNPFPDSLFEPSVEKRRNPYADIDEEIYQALDLRVVGEAAAPDFSGRSYYSYIVARSTTNLSSVYTVDRTVPPQVSETVTVNFDGGWSTPIPLKYSGYTCQVSQEGSQALWHVSGYSRPTFSLPKIVENLRKLGPDLHSQIFGTTDSEPYATFRNCWELHPDFAYRFAGFLVAYIYRIEESDRSLGYVPPPPDPIPYFPSLDFQFENNSQYYFLGWM